ncbi:MAG TPA: hypothetical protein VGQ55_02240 [Pyrinomonadaceae bacterium]|jgi:hypothetical protein|nr:hypothetical protein [Pyrinomonadaceae bacterium]
MRRENALNSNDLTNAGNTGDRKVVRNSRTRSLVFTVLAFLGVFGGMSALFVGLVFVVIHGVLSGDVIFNQVGTGLLFVAIPMILLGSVCADAIEGKK